MMFDSHCHLNDENLYPRIDEVIEAAKKTGVKKFLVVGYDKASSLLAVKIAEKYEECYAAIGFHPTEIDGVSEEDYNEVMSLSSHKKVVAIGEIGLDYHWVKDEEKRENQKKWFIKQIEYANDHHLPISIHNRESTEDCVEILKEHTPKYSGVMHCYSGSVETMNIVLNLGMYIALGGTVTFTNAKTPKEVAEAVPLDRLLIETDSPYLTPHPHRGEKNEPKYICLVLEEIARLKDMSKKHLEDVIYKNTCRLFNVDE
ncbi:MAG: TatD family hydrolase [Bacilli bacterium]|nr:TatD family hydrolase [Bacilli bacterium]